MKTATTTDLRKNFRRVLAWIEGGEVVQIVKRGKAFAQLIPETKAKRKLPDVDFAARRKAVWGNRVFSSAEVEAMRESELGNERPT